MTSGRLQNTFNRDIYEDKLILGFLHYLYVKTEIHGIPDVWLESPNGPGVARWISEQSTWAGGKRSKR
jgi:hypothetical protein